jgi:hypothetical protein
MTLLWGCRVFFVLAGEWGYVVNDWGCADFEAVQGSYLMSKKEEACLFWLV